MTQKPEQNKAAKVLVACLSNGLDLLRNVFETICRATKLQFEQINLHKGEFFILEVVRTHIITPIKGTINSSYNDLTENILWKANF